MTFVWLFLGALAWLTIGYAGVMIACRTFERLGHGEPHDRTRMAWLAIAGIPTFLGSSLFYLTERKRFKPKEQTHGLHRRPDAPGNSDTADRTDPAGFGAQVDSGPTGPTFAGVHANVLALYGSSGAQGTSGLSTCQACGQRGSMVLYAGVELCSQCYQHVVQGGPSVQNAYHKWAQKQSSQANMANMYLAQGGSGNAVYSGNAAQTAQYQAMLQQWQQATSTTSLVDTSWPPKPSEAIPRGEIITGEIIAWRSWRIIGGYLRSTSFDHIWVPDEPVAGDLGDNDWEGAGVHAFKSRADATKYALGLGLVAIGQVRLWGEVLEATEGYRAQYAKVHSLVDVVDGNQKDGGALGMVHVIRHDADTPTLTPRNVAATTYTNADLLNYLRQKYGVNACPPPSTPTPLSKA